MKQKIVPVKNNFKLIELVIEILLQACNINLALKAFKHSEGSSKNRKFLNN